MAGRILVPGHDQKPRIPLEHRDGGLLVLRELEEELEAHANGETTAEVLSSHMRAILQTPLERRE